MQQSLGKQQGQRKTKHQSKHRTSCLSQWHTAHELLQDQADAPGGQQCFEGIAVEAANHGAFQKDAHHATCDEGQRNRHQNVGVINGLKHRQLEDQLNHISGVSPKHDQLAMREIDHTHQTKNDRQSEGSHQEHRADGHTVEQALK